MFTVFRPLARKLLTAPVVRRVFTRPICRASRLHVEPLEDRWVLAAIAILGAEPSDRSSYLDDVKAQLVSSGVYVPSDVDVINVSTATPSVTALNQYDAVLVYSEYTLKSQVGLANNLAAFVDAGGGVVQAAGTFSATGGIAAGNWNLGYRAFDFNGKQSTDPRLSLGTVTQPTHPALTGVSNFDGGSPTYYQTNALASGASLIASWSNGQSLLAERTGKAGRILGLNMFPFFSILGVDPNSGDALLLANALEYVSKGSVGLRVTDLTDVTPDPITTAVDSVDLTFSTPIDTATLTAADLTLTRDGAAVAISDISVTPLTGTTYRVGGLGSATAADGNYVLTAAGAGVTDLAGGLGAGIVRDAWQHDSVPGAPTVSGTTPTDGASTPFLLTTIGVQFDEPVTQATAGNPANYQLSDPYGRSIPVTAATLDGSGTFVTLSFDPLYEIGSSQLRVGAVSDVAGNRRPPIMPFTTPATIVSNSVSGNNQGMVVADFNEDGRADAVVAQSSTKALAYFTGQPAGTFAAGVALSAALGGSTTSSLSAGDLDGDGHLDLVAADGTFGASVYYGNGDGTFAARTSYPATFGSSNFSVNAVAIRDVDGDGRPDVVASAGAVVSTFLNLGSRTWSAAVSSATGASGSSFFLDDLNGDGHLDLLQAGTPASVLLGTSTPGRFLFSTSVNTGGAASGTWAYVDLDGDGHPDLINGARGVMVCYGTGSVAPYFAARVNLGIPDTSQLAFTVVPADVDGDGDIDLVVTQSPNLSSATPGKVTVITNLGHRQFASQTLDLSGQGIAGVSQLFLTDLTGDGLPDLIGSATGDDALFVVAGQRPAPDASFTIAPDSSSPAFAQTDYAFDLAENSGDGTAVGVADATDPNAGAVLADAILAGNESGAFALNAATGQVTVADRTKLDYETTAAFELKVAVTDDGSPARFATATITIHLFDVNEPPSGVTLSPSSISEHAGPNAVIGTLRPVDPDAGGTYTYALVDSADDALFTIVGNQLGANQSFVYADQSTYTVQVQITDQGGLSAEQTLTVAVTTADVNYVGGPESLANEATTGDQRSPAIAVAADGSFVAAWASDQGGTGFDVYARRFDPMGSPLGGEFRVNTVTAGDQTTPAVAVDGAGNFVIVWASAGEDGSGAGIFDQRYASDGSLQGGEFRVNTYTTGNQQAPAVAAAAGGSFVVAWESQQQDGSGYGIYGQPFDAAGAPVGTELWVNGGAALGNQREPAVAVDSAGGFVIVWADDGPELLGGYGVYARRFGPTGTASAITHVNTTTNSEQRNPAVATTPAVGFIVAWQSDAQDGSGFGMYAQRYDAGGGAIGTETRLNHETAGSQTRPSIAVAADGALTAAWQTVTAEGAADVYARRFAADGTPLSDEVRLDVPGSDPRQALTIGVSAVGSMAAVWEAAGGDGDGFGIATRVFRLPRPTITMTTLPENAGANAVVGLLAWPAYEPGQAATFGLVPGAADDSLFNVNGHELRANASFDFEARSMYTVVVRATADGATADQAFTITLTDVNDAPTGITLTGSSVSENAGTDAVVGSLTGADPDANSVLTFSLPVGQAENDLFNLSGNQLRATASFDYEAAASHAVVIRVTDQGGLSFDQAFIVTVTNVSPEVVPVGPEVRANTYTSASQWQTAVAANAAGDYVVVWESIIQEGTVNDVYGVSRGIYAQRFSVLGIPVGGEIHVNTATVGDQRLPAVGMSATGEFVVAWQSDESLFGEPDGDGSGIFAQRFAADGTKVGGEFLVNTTTAGNQESPAVTVNAAGQFVIAWKSYNPTTGQRAVRAQLYTAGGTPVLGESLVSPVYPQDRLAVGIDDGGNYVVTWESNDGGTSQGIYARRYDSTSTPLGTAVLVNTLTTGNQLNPAIAVGGAGEFVVTWDGNGFGDTQGIFARRFDGNGTALDATEFRVNSFTAGLQSHSSIARDGSGDFEVAWDGGGVFVQVFNAAGVEQGNPLTVNESSANSPGSPTVAAAGDGNFVVAWFNGTGESDAFVRRFDDVDRNRAPLGAAQSHAYVPENSAPDAVVGTVLGLDPDAVDAFTFELPAGQADNDFFALNGDQLHAAATFDHEVSSAYTVLIRVIDRGGLTLDCPVTVFVANLPDAPGDVTLTNAAVLENAGTDAVVGDLTIPGADPATAATFELVAGQAENAFFNLSGTQLRANASFDHEMKDSYTILVRATSGGETIDESFTVTVVDVSPEFVPVGPEVQVNTYTTADQTRPAIGIDAVGNYVVAWQSNYNQDGSGVGIYAQRYDAAGRPLGGEFRVNTTTTGDQASPIVAENGSGDFLIAWAAPSGYDAQRYDAAGQPLGGEFALYPATTSQPSGVAVAMASEGSFVVTWSQGVPTANVEVFALRYDSAGNPLGSPVLVNEFTTGAQSHPGIGLAADGSFVITWQSDAQDAAGGAGVYARRFDAAGNPLTSEFPVNTYTTNSQEAPSVGVDATGDFVIAWTSDGQGEDNTAVYARRYRPDSTPAGGEFHVNEYTYSYQLAPVARTDANGDFIIAWGSYGADGSHFGVSARVYNVQGIPQSGEFRVNTFTTGPQGQPALAVDQGGDFVIAWSSQGQDTDYSSDGVFTQRYDNLDDQRAPLSAVLMGAAVEENAGANAPFGTVAPPSDADAGDSAVRSLPPELGDNAFFHLSGNQLLANASFDYEIRSTYTVVVRTTDTTGRTTDSAIAISVLNVYEAPTNLLLTNAAIPENAGANAVVGRLAVEPPNAGSAYAYSLVSGPGSTDNAQFAIDGDQLVARASLNYEAKATYSVRVRVVNESGVAVVKAFLIAVTDVNDPPVVSFAAMMSYAENAAATLVAGLGSVADVDTPTFAGGSLTAGLTAGALATDRLTLKNQGTGAGQVGVSGTTVTYDGVAVGSVAGGAGTTPLVVRFVNAATPAAVQAVLRTVQFQNVSDDPTAGGSSTSRTLAVAIDDGDGGTGTATKTIAVTAVNDPPALGGIASSALYVENAVLLLAPAATAADPDSADLAGGQLTVALTANAGANDRLAIRNQGTDAGQVGVVGSEVTVGDTVVGTVSGGIGTTPLTVVLNAAATPAAAQAILRNVTYQLLGDAPVAVNRTVKFSVADGDGGTSAAVTQTVAVVPVNDAPAVGGIASPVGYTENAILLLAPVGTVVDPDSPDFDTGKLTVTITANAGINDRLMIRNQGITAGQVGVDGSTISTGGIPVGSFTGGVGTTPLVVTFNANTTPARVQLVLRNLTYQLLSDNPAVLTRTVKFTLTDGDGGSSAAVNQSLTIQSVNDTPVLGSLASPIVYTENATLFPAAAATVTDPDSSNFDTGKLTVAITANAGINDRLAIRNQGTGSGQVGTSGTSVTYGGVAIGSFAGGTGTTPLVVTFNASATPTATRTVLRNVTYQLLTDNPAVLTRTLKFTLTDGDGGSATATQALTIVPVNDAPVLTGFASPLTYTENGTLLLAPSATASDVDSANFGTGTLTVTLTAGGWSADRLAIRNQGTGPGQVGVSGSTVTYQGTAIGTVSGGGTDPLVITFNTAATPTAVQVVLRNVTFSNASESPTNFGANPSRTVRTVLTDGDGGTSATRTQSITVKAVNDVPVLGGVPATARYTENDVLVLAPTATVADVDSLDLSGGKLTVTLTANAGVNDRLAVRHQGTGPGEVGVSGTTITYGGAAVGTKSGGVGTTPLVVTFTAAATPAVVQAVLRNVTYQLLTDNPMTLTRTVQFVLTDGDGGTPIPVTQSLAIGPVNDAPVLGGVPASTAFQAGSAAIVLASDATVADVDSVNLEGGTLTVSQPGGSLSSDRLAVRHQGFAAGQIGVSGTQITFGGATNVIGTLSGGGGSEPLVVTFTNKATVAAVQSLLRNVTFGNTSADPTSGGAVPTRTVRFVLTDGDGGTSLMVDEVINVTM